MITFDVKLDGTQPKIEVYIPLSDYLLDDFEVETAKETIEGIRNLCSHSVALFVNGEETGINKLEGIIETYRSLYLLKLLDDVLARVKPLNDSVVMEIVEKVEPLIDNAKAHINWERKRH